MKREIQNNEIFIELIQISDLGEAHDWLQTKTIEHNLRWLLAHADDGVLWGENRNDQLITSDSVAPDISPPLRTVTLQQARLFSPDAELLLWRDGDNAWQARLMRLPQNSEPPTYRESIDEHQMLWGTNMQSLEKDFTLLSDGVQGLRHVVPLAVKQPAKKDERPLRLKVRHYLEEDETGFTRIAASRLVDILDMQQITQREPKHETA